MTTTTTSTAVARSLTCAETAKLLRASLKTAFPGVKFSVRSDRYAGGASIRVTWVDGPTVKPVQSICDRYAGGRFDGMTDLAYSADHWVCPKHGPSTAEIYGNSYTAEQAGTGVGNGPVASRCCADVELVHFGSDHVFTTRELSAAYRNKLEDAAREIIASNADSKDMGWDRDRWYPSLGCEFGVIRDNNGHGIIRWLSQHIAP